jgi:hypothetical protein
MTYAIAITVGILGVVAMVLGVFIYFLFRCVMSEFDTVLKVQYAEQDKADVAPRIWKISNPLVRDIVGRHLAATKGVLAIATTRCAFQSRQRQGLEAAVAGALLTLSAYYTNSWLPLIWGPA